jgi:hypothetical protein
VKHSQTRPSHEDAFRPCAILLSEILAALILLAVILTVGTFFLSTTYGVVLLLFRLGFGVEVLDPFNWLPLGGDRDSASLDVPAKLQT